MESQDHCQLAELAATDRLQLSAWKIRGADAVTDKTLRGFIQVVVLIRWLIVGLGKNLLFLVRI
jgi:hypothetical protein